MAQFPLSLATPGEWVRIVALRGKDEIVHRLQSLGLRIGGCIEVLQREGACGAVIRRETGKVALDAGLTRRILVEHING